jgi:hypothetical protein
MGTVKERLAVVSRLKMVPEKAMLTTPPVLAGARQSAALKGFCAYLKFLKLWTIEAPLGPEVGVGCGVGVATTTRVVTTVRSMT